MSSTNPDNTLTSAEAAHLKELEAIVQRGLDTDLELGNALAEISDASLYRATHQTFEAYLRDRWEIRRSPDDQLSQIAETADPPSSDPKAGALGMEPGPRAVPPVRARARGWLASMWEQAGRAFGGDSVPAVDIRITVHTRDQSAELTRALHPNPGRPDDSEGAQLLARLGSLLTQSSGTIAEVARHLETHAADLDDDAREQLRDDLLATDEELATLKALLEPVDWNAEHGRLLAGEIPPLQHDPDDD
jgi:hypothetical protein